MAEELKDTLNLPVTDFPMRAGLAEREPVRIAHWERHGLYGQIQARAAGKPAFVLHYEAQGVAVDLFAVGKKGRDQLSKLNTLAGSDIDVVANVTFEAARSIAQDAMDKFIDGTYDEVVVVYNQFKNAAVQLIREEVVLPIQVPSVSASGDYLYEPNKEELLLNLIPTHIHIQFFKALLDSQASEQGSRMTAMHKATDNAKSMRDELKLDYNKARQAAITNEILEIVGGAEALNG